jgi:methionyl aminopeptidase
MSGDIPLRTPQELFLMREPNRIVAEVLERMREMVAPSVTTAELDAAAEEHIRSRGGRPAFKGYVVGGKQPFPASLCTSVNDMVVHGIPNGRPLREGDIVSVDVGVERNGWFGDGATTIAVGRVSPQAERLMAVCREALDLAIDRVKPGGLVSDIGEAVQGHAEANGYSVVQQLVGHGIGTALHQAPEVPNFVPGPRSRSRVVMEPGLVMAIEPMINAGRYKVKEDRRNRWEVRTTDGSLSAHFEHTVAVTPRGHEILTLP